MGCIPAENGIPQRKPFYTKSTALNTWHDTFVPYTH